MVEEVHAGAVVQPEGGVEGDATDACLFEFFIGNKRVVDTDVQHRGCTNCSKKNRIDVNSADCTIINAMI